MIDHRTGCVAFFAVMCIAAPGRPHLVTNAGERSMTFLVLQGVGEYDYVPMV